MREPPASSLDFMEALYADFLRDPDSVPADWRTYFESLNGAGGNGAAPARKVTAAVPRPQTRVIPAATVAPSQAPALQQLEMATLQHRVDQLIRNYRVRGHIVARVDPLGFQRPEPPELDPGYYRFTQADMDRPFSTENLPGRNERTLRSIVERLRNTYCGSVGVQFMHIDDLYVREWLQERMESSQNHAQLSRREQLGILTRLTDAVIFEEFIQKK